MFLIPAFFSGCAETSSDVQQGQLLERDGELTCTAADPHRCAIPSHLQDLADEVASLEDPLHYVTLFDVGEDELLARIHMVRAARESIVLQSFIYDDDEVGRMYFRELLAAARRGVRVRLILDQYGTYIAADVLAAMAMAHENLDIKFFSPIMNRGGKSKTREIGTLFLNFKEVNERMHNKLFAIDGRMALVGGRNIRNAYFDYDPKVNFKDLGMLVVGPVVETVYQSFDIYWNHEMCVAAMDLPDIAAAALDPNTLSDTSTEEEFAWLDQAANSYSIYDERPALIVYPVHRVEYIADWPIKDHPAPQASQWDSTERIESILLSARRSIIMQTPYLIHDFKGILEFGTYRKHHPKVDIALSTNSLASSDMSFGYAFTFKQRQYYLKDLNSRLFEFKPVPEDILLMTPRHAESRPPGAPKDLNARPDEERLSGYDGPTLCLHSKFFVVDDAVSFVGSHNFDPRASNLNTENGFIVWDEAVGLELHRIFDRDTAPQNSWVAAWHPKWPVIGNISDRIATLSNRLPVFDLWPFYYSNTYDLKDGKPPLPPQHPDFYDHYQADGAFPQVGWIDRLQVRLFMAFGGLARGFL